MNLWALGIHTIVVVGLCFAMLGISALLGERHSEPATGEPYESGIVGTGSTQVRLSIHFYLVAMFFVVFDLEAVFLYAWAVAAPELGWAGYIEVVIFVAILLVGLAYLWTQGALDWGTAARMKRMKAMRLPAGDTMVRVTPAPREGVRT
jgi:NADH-quinone oxidoreductase subunit A